MTATKKAFTLSLSLHTFMALSALWILSRAELSDHAPLNSKPMMLMVSLQSVAQTPLQMPSPAESAPAENLAKPVPATPVQRVPRQQTASETPSPAAVLPSAALPKAAVSPVTVPTAAAVSPAKTQAPIEEPKADRSAEKSVFYASLRSRIQQHLRYPPAARRRGMEGDVAVRFLLDPGGAIRDISVLRGEAMFHTAATLAVSSASGVKIPETLKNDFPNTIELTLEFRLKGNS
ncbi:MAG: hypothetical protein JU82_02885 [Sulfuricurvum sp. MLSB]|uniref:energy transducer TonB n=1 Tax=unclassified Sulfuricurvum TaxID=2632390 RepID=UPI000506DC4C|nr:MULTISPECIES: TonB family protein [unclassified Sulfuricurvum]KFN40471.1 MAG: hypothetical protein JU82_02885 [Sulfuricurvum sp. MLSB]